MVKFVTSHLVVEFGTNSSGAIWWPILQPMQVVPSGGQIWNWVRCASGNVSSSFHSLLDLLYFLQRPLRLHIPSSCGLLEARVLPQRCNQVVRLSEKPPVTDVLSVQQLHLALFNWLPTGRVLKYQVPGQANSTYSLLPCNKNLPMQN